MKWRFACLSSYDFRLIIFRISCPYLFTSLDSVNWIFLSWAWIAKLKEFTDNKQFFAVKLVILYIYSGMDESLAWKSKMSLVEIRPKAYDVQMQNLACVVGCKPELKIEPGLSLLSFVILSTTWHFTWSDSVDCQLLHIYNTSWTIVTLVQWCQTWSS